jgi:hypothetical protein
MSKTKAAELYTAYSNLEAATEAYYKAIAEFQKVYNPESVGLDEFCEHINCVMVEIDAELDEVI